MPWQSMVFRKETTIKRSVVLRAIADRVTASLDSSILETTDNLQPYILMGTIGSSYSTYAVLSCARHLLVSSQPEFSLQHTYLDNMYVQTPNTTSSSDEVVKLKGSVHWTSMHPTTPGMLFPSLKFLQALQQRSQYLWMATNSLVWR
jgi:hypothetical protein